MAVHTGPCWNGSSARLGEQEGVRGERSPPSQVVTISPLQTLREWLSIPMSESEVILGVLLVACHLKQVSPVPCFKDFVPAADKALDSQGNCIQLYEFFPAKNSS